ncbi:MAG: 3-keto-5-aminohexanoate cleavage protein [bacterium]
MKKLIINLCPTGMVSSKQANPRLPVTASEIIKSSLACVKLGASIIHIHPRDENGNPTWKKEEFGKIIDGIRSQNDKVILNATTSGRAWSDFERRSECLDLKGDLRPDMASLTVGSMNFISTASVNPPDIIEQLAIKMQEKGIKPELEVFEPGMLHKANYLIEKGIIKDSHPYFNILLGSLGTSPLHPVVFSSFYSLLPANAVWSIAGVGQYQLDANVMSMSMGGGVRVGLEDNQYFDRDKSIMASNEMLVSRIVKIAKLMQLEIATPAEARVMLGL